MKYLNNNALIYILFTPVASLIIWLFSTHTFTQLVNIFFTISILVGILLFTLLIVQEGILDVTSYGFRKFRYQMMRKKNRSRLEDDEFFNPKAPKKAHHFVSPWIKPALIMQLIYFLLAIIIAYLI
ncbi:DUF3899 domain-containing protein [Staphylococcus pseudintermedius]|uniref:DUF3899 domain-containing protein n=1 Tax=Staphylococcus pseudintermedius TaxID=283734 RepID=UPI0025528CB4|nr:DUF3899 domain-containing protein [Staphylococcus pseudintermedius]EJY6956082.1 DUF3899 domain-containing protein [Staphylococcus pseudintermedius]EKH2195170.1 DUF3899 domain-containing protein [Staphylococcus pseudintermedius]MDK9609972.1 DUF3899 domain-containing protein [Staphylococcus pseudintermedius]